MNFGQLQEEISKVSLPVKADLGNDFKWIILKTDQRKIYPLWGKFWRSNKKYLQYFINNATYHPMNPDADVAYQAVSFFSSDKCFIYIISDVPHYIWWNQHKTICKILVKLDVPDTCRAMICPSLGISFLLLFMKIENTVYTSFQNSMLLFINGLIFDIINIQNNKFLEFEWIPQCQHHLDPSIMIEGFHGFVIFSLSFSKIG